MARYNRRDIDSTLEAARRVAKRDNLVYHVFATAYGFTISKDYPYWQRSYTVNPDGTVTLSGFTRNRWPTSVLSGVTDNTYTGIDTLSPSAGSHASE